MPLHHMNLHGLIQLPGEGVSEQSLLSEHVVLPDVLADDPTMVALRVVPHPAADWFPLDTVLMGAVVLIMPLSSRLQAPGSLPIVCTFAFWTPLVCTISHFIHILALVKLAWNQAHCINISILGPGKIGSDAYQ